MERISGDDDRDMMIGSPSSDGKMVIKLKIPKLGDKSPGEDVNGILSKTVFCLECKKEFSSGKALGGHMRVHVQSANKNPNFLKPATKFKKTVYQDFNNGDGNPKMIHTKKEQQQRNLKPYYMKSVNDEGKPTCSQCGKTFPSMKSLFGHMRCHPERVWRGILPPPNSPTTPAAVARRRTIAANISNPSASASASFSFENGLSINDDDSGDLVVDLTKYLRGWSVTDRRGRKALKAADDDEVSMEAVEDLMSLANGGASIAESGVTNKDKTDENSPSIDLRVKGKAVMGDEIDGKLTAKLELDDDESNSMNINEQLSINYEYKKNSVNSPQKSCPYKIKRRKKMKLMMELEKNADVTGGRSPSAPLPEQQPVTECKYKCTDCNKCFASHQALGGHRSSHKKSKFTSTDHHQIEEDDYESFVMNQSGENLEKEGQFADHQCKICDKIFATGQALGGHKSCHWIGTGGTNETQAPSSRITSTGEAASQTGSGRKVLDFDLNEIPPTMMEEDEAANVNGNGYASSSYNSNIG